MEPLSRDGGGAGSGYPAVAPEKTPNGQTNKTADCQREFPDNMSDQSLALHGGDHDIDDKPPAAHVNGAHIYIVN